MKKQFRFCLIGILLFLLFVVVSVLTFNNSKSRIKQGYLASEGSAAENFAVLAAANIHLTDAQVEALKQCSYEELLNTEENKELQQMMSNSGFVRSVDFAYIMIRLDDSEIKYTVTEELAERYDAPVGTKLDIMWLLDVNVSDYTGQLQSVSGNDEYQRYGYYIPEDEAIFTDEPTYIFNTSEWGDHICGYAPIYTVEGNYIGALGVELQTGNYDAYCGQAVLAIQATLFVSLLLLVALFLFIYFRDRKTQYKKIYVDPLVEIYNRSYYNTQFIKKINSARSGPIFALFIADVDWFKKVNDTFGHEVGDEVLVELGAILTGVFEKKHVVRFGGEEFVAGAWVQDERELSEKLDGLFAKVAEHSFSSREIPLTISLGCAWHYTRELNGWLLSTMLRAADCKLYEAKENGRNQYIIEAFDENKVYNKSTDEPEKQMWREDHE